MKLFRFLFIFTTVISGCIAFSCKKEETPVDKYIEILDQTTNKIESIQNLDQIQELQEITDSPNVTELKLQYSDYELTEKDKEKLKKSWNKFLDVSFNKTMELLDFPENVKELKKEQVDQIIKDVDEKIDNASTLGEIGNM